MDKDKCPSTNWFLELIGYILAIPVAIISFPILIFLFVFGWIIKTFEDLFGTE